MKWIQTLPQGPDRTKALQTIYQGMQNNENFDYDREVVEDFAREHGFKEKSLENYFPFRGWLH